MKLKVMLKMFLSFLVRERLYKSRILNFEEYINIFFGYYDSTPYNKKDEDLICFHGERKDRNVDILLYSTLSNVLVKLDTSSAWNYQQGARLSWFNDDELIYNKYSIEDKCYFANVMNVNTRSECRFPYPVQTFYKNEYLLSLDYWKLNELGTEYGYPIPDQKYPRNSIVYYNIRNNESEVLFDINDCMNVLKNTYSETEKAHVNHLLISPDGTYFIFIFRFYTGAKRIDHLMGYSLKENEIDLLIENEVISHCNWQNDKKIIFWGVIGNQSGYYIYDVDSKEDSQPVYATIEDGHPTFIEENEILTDTYPNRFLCQELYILNIKSKKIKRLIRKKHPAFYRKEERCDLHPSISPSKKLFQIDIIHKGKRNICLGRI